MRKMFMICLLLTMLMANGSTISYADSSIGKQTFTDTKGHWSESVIDKWMKLGVVTGYANGEFHPNETMTRAGITVMLNRLFRAVGEPVALVGGGSMSPSGCSINPAQNVFLDNVVLIEV
jgi:hypothetical protein